MYRLVLQRYGIFSLMTLGPCIVLTELHYPYPLRVGCYDIVHACTNSNYHEYMYTMCCRKLFAKSIDRFVYIYSASLSLILQSFLSTTLYIQEWTTRGNICYEMMFDRPYIPAKMIYDTSTGILTVAGKSVTVSWWWWQLQVRTCTLEWMNEMWFI